MQDRFSNRLAVELVKAKIGQPSRDSKVICDILDGNSLRGVLVDEEVLRIVMQQNALAGHMTPYATDMEAMTISV